MRACADRPDDDGTWISDEILECYVTLHRLGIAHSVEAWQNGALAGGLYGVAAVVCCAICVSGSLIQDLKVGHILGGTPRSMQIGDFLAGGQPNAGDLLELRKQGVRSIVNLRLTQEVSDGPTPEQEGGLASVLGLAFAHLPVSVDHLSEQDVRAFEDAISDLPAPVYVHCGLGQRAATLALLADWEASAPASEAIAKAEQQGIAISPKVRDFIERYFEQRQIAQQEDEVTFARVIR